MLKHVNTRIALGIVVSLAFLIGTLAAPVAALRSNMVTELYPNVFPASENNHTYVYMEPDIDRIVSGSWLHCNADIDMTQYSYDQGGWSVSTDSYSEPTSYGFSWEEHSTLSNGPFGNPTLLPTYYDFIGSSGGPAVINTTQERRTFSLAFGQHTPVVVDDDEMLYVGGLSISGQEYVHLLVDCRNDGVMWEVGILDPDGRYLGIIAGSGGDILVLPFKPSVAGVYQVLLGTSIGSGDVAIFDIMPQAVAPTPIALGEVATGDLPTGELLTHGETGSWIHQELAPTVHTYKVTCPNDVGRVSYVFNYPAIAFATTQPVNIMFTSESFEHDVGLGSRYFESSTMPGNGAYHYCGETHYVTVMGGDGVSYALYHEAIGTPLPVNQEVLLENIYSSEKDTVYRLDVDTPSTLRVNTTSPADYEFILVGYHDDGYRFETSLSDATIIESSSEQILLPGVYFIRVTVDSTTYDEYVEFNLGEFVETSQADITRIGGFIVDTDTHSWYNITLRMNNADNVTVSTVLIAYDQFGSTVFGASYALANWYDGSTIIPHSTYENYVTIMLGANEWSEDFAYLSILPFAVINNTAPGGNEYEDYPVDYEVEVVNRMGDFTKEVTTLDATSQNFYNFSLSAVGDAVEYRGVYLNTTPGTWYNVSIKTNDVTAVQVDAYFNVDGRTYYVPWADLSYAYVGSPDDLAFEFGSIGEEALFIVRVNRALSDSGALWIQLTPLETNQLNDLGPIRSGSNILAQLGGLAIPLAGGGIVIIVVAVIYLKKYKQ